MYKVYLKIRNEFILVDGMWRYIDHAGVSDVLDDMREFGYDVDVFAIVQKEDINVSNN